MKALKWIIGVVLLILVGFVFYLTVVFDPNDFKPQIIAAVEKQTGRTLAIDQDLSWTFFPTIGIKAGGISLSNPKNFSEKQMVAVNEIVANVDLLPLLSKQVKISQLKLDGLQLNLETTKDGRTSFEGLMASDEGQGGKTPADASSQRGNIMLEGLNIGGIDISNAQVKWLDSQQATENVFTLESLTVGALALDSFAPITYKLNGKMPDMTVSSEGQGQLKISSDLKQISLKDFTIHNNLAGVNLPKGELKADLTTNIQLNTGTQTVAMVLNKLALADINGSGELNLSYGSKVPQVDATLALGTVDLDKLMPAAEANTTEQPAAATSVAATSVEPDLNGMKAVNMTLRLTIASLKAAGVTTDNWVINTKLHNGVLEVQKLTADLYQGSLTASAKVDGRNKLASYSFDSELKQVNLRPLLRDAADVDMLAGTANINAKGSGRSLIPENIKKNLDVSGNFNIADGALYGVNIPLMIRNAQAKLKGDLSSQSGEEEKTDFTSLTGSFTVKDGLANNPDLLMSSPLIRLSGAGGANLLQETLDYRLKTSLVSTLKGQGGKTTDQLAGVEIPLLISGTFAKPKYSLDTDALFKNKLKDETEKVKDKLKDSLLKKLGGG